MKTNKACAACKYQRRKCTRECMLAPYFPADRPKMFGDAHRLFGVSNIQKILNEIKDKGKRDQAMTSIIVESNIRAKFPVNGCLDVIKLYEGMLLESYAELNLTNMLLAFCKRNNHSQQQNLHSSLPYTSSQIPNNYGDNMMIASSSYISDIIPHDVNNTLIDTKPNINPMNTTRVSNSGDVDVIKEFDGDKFDSLDDDVLFNIDDLMDDVDFRRYQLFFSIYLFCLTLVLYKVLFIYPLLHIF
jgi:hypothetical protein